MYIWQNQLIIFLWFTNKRGQVRVGTPDGCPATLTWPLVGRTYPCQRGLQLPNLRVIVDDCCQSSLIKGDDADLSLTKSAIVDRGDQLMISVERERTSVCYHGNDVRVIIAGLDSWRGTAQQQMRNH